MRNRFWITLLLLPALLLGAIFCFRVRSDHTRRLQRLDKRISYLLKEYSVEKSDAIIIKEYTVGEVLDIEDFKEKLENLLDKNGFKLLRYEAKYRRGKGSCIFEIGIAETALYVLKLIDVLPSPKKAKALRKRGPVKVAIVIDDWGYNMKNIELLYSIEIPLTVSILPNLPYSYRIAYIQHVYEDREVMLHMPMEPESKGVRLERYTLLTSMDKREILELLRAASKTVPHARGLSNHMGSKATQDRRLIGTVMKELGRNDLYFLDSLATPDAICEEEADRLKLRFIKRDVFLDNIPDKEYISSQMDKLIEIAKRRGYAVGMGHDRRLTLQVIKEKAAELSGDDIKFVFVSELAKRQR